MSNKGTFYYLDEIFSSFQGEGGSVQGSCFGKRQIFIRLAGCNLALGDFNSRGCFWCDSKKAQNPKVQYFKFENSPGLQNMDTLKNPVKDLRIIKIIKNLITPDLHSISFTGGEPLFQTEALLALHDSLKNAGINYPFYLETNGSIIPNKENLKKFGKSFTYCCCDIKDRSSEAASPDKWKDLVKIEVKFISEMVRLGVKTFAKLVVTSKTDINDIKWISHTLSEIKYEDGLNIGLAIQPVVLFDEKIKKKYAISNQFLNTLFYTASEFIPPESLTLSIQAHKYLNFL